MSETQEYWIEEWISFKYLIKVEASSEKEALERYHNNDIDEWDREEVEFIINDYEISPAPWQTLEM